jgi:hypothetical protein
VSVAQPLVAHRRSIRSVLRLSPPLDRNRVDARAGSSGPLTPCLPSEITVPRMEHVWSRAVATCGNRWKLRAPRKPLGQAKAVAAGCDRLPFGAHGEEGVEGSGPSGGSQDPRPRGFVVHGTCSRPSVRWVWSGRARVWAGNVFFSSSAAALRVDSVLTPRTWLGPPTTKRSTSAAPVGSSSETGPASTSGPCARSELAIVSATCRGVSDHRPVHHHGPQRGSGSHRRSRLGRRLSGLGRCRDWRRRWC